MLIEDLIIDGSMTAAILYMIWDSRKKIMGLERRCTFLEGYARSKQL